MYPNCLLCLFSDTINVFWLGCRACAWHSFEISALCKSVWTQGGKWKLDETYLYGWLKFSWSSHLVPNWFAQKPPSPPPQALALYYIVLALDRYIILLALFLIIILCSHSVYQAQHAVEHWCLMGIQISALCKPVWNKVGTPAKIQPTVKVGLVQLSFYSFL